MKEIIKIYIDHAGRSDSLEFRFAGTLQKRLSIIEPKPTISTFHDEYEKWTDENAAALLTYDTDWEYVTINSVDSADIIIPIVTSDYMTYTSNSVSSSFNKIINSDNKYLFPILFGPFDWSAINWIVKSKLIQGDNIPLIDQSSEKIDEVINELIRTVRDITKRNNYETTSTINVVDGNITAGGLIHFADKANLISSFCGVFISHSHDDSDFAELLKLKLEKENIESWLDNEKLKIGQDWQVEIDDAIDRSMAVIAIMTPEARKSEYVTYEWAYAWGKGKKVFPIMLKQTQLHPRLESLQYLDFTNRNTRPFSTLIDAIKALI